ncbi:MAG: hypothetical protein ACAI25_06100 [Planctomycetota bacterium]
MVASVAPEAEAERIAREAVDEALEKLAKAPKTDQKDEKKKPCNYFIMSGVRRALAALFAGHASILATVLNEGPPRVEWVSLGPCRPRDATPSGRDCDTVHRGSASGTSRPGSLDSTRPS